MFTYLDLLSSLKIYFKRQGELYIVVYNTVEPPVATTSRKRPPLLSDQFSKTPKVSKSNHYIWNLL